MAYSNFDFLSEKFPVLAHLGRLAEKYVYSDSNSCLFKLGMMGETMVKLMFDYDGIELPREDKAVNRINKLRREDLLDADTAMLFHSLRKIRNQAGHEGYESVSDARNYLGITYSLSEWFMQTYGDYQYKNRPFVMPTETPEPVKEDKVDEEALEKILLQQAAENAAKAPKVNKADRQKYARKASNQRYKSEAETRVLIDEQLRQVGWEADTENLRYSKGTRPQKGRCLAIAEWPTDSPGGKGGFADYALFIDLQLVAIIEAKAEHKDVAAVIDGQCKEYPKYIKKQHHEYVLGQWGDYQVPFTFATNGKLYLEQLRTKSGIWFLDLRQKTNRPQPLRGWFSPLGLTELLARDTGKGNEKLQAMPYAVLQDPDGLNLRAYQIAAIQAAEKAVLDGRQNILLAMATGTGKTRTVLGMIYRFLKTNRFQRILFLVDRNSLGMQAHDVFKDVKLEELMSLNQIYNIKGLDEKLIDRETRVQVATVQGMIQRIVFNEDERKPSVSDYDLIIVDEAHRGYTLDKMMDEEEMVYRDQRDYQSKYRAVIEYFTAVKIALTATPALHTTQIFGEPIFKYTYREAVIDGFLVDYDAPHIIKTRLSEEGIHYGKGDTVAIYDPATGEITNSEALEDELDFDVESFNRQIIVPDFNRKVLAEIAKDIDPTDEFGGKTLIYAVNDAHADMIVDILREIYADMDIDQDAIMKITGSIENGNQKKIQEVIRQTRNNQYPSIIVTVDLLTTGIDIPAITRLVFLRRVKSRILFEQMLGRATRLCPAMGKDHFEIYDPVGTFASLEKVSTMKPVVANPAATITKLIDTLVPEAQSEDKSVLTHQIDQLLAKIQRKGRNLTTEQEQQFMAMTGAKSYADYARDLAEQDDKTARDRLIKDRAAFSYLENYIRPGRPQVVSDATDEVTYHVQGYGNAQQRPEDYLDEFTSYIKKHINEVAAINIICTKPAELTRKSLKELSLLLDREGYAPTQLDSAITALNAEEAGADIISIIRRYAIGARLMNHREKVEKAVKRLRANHKFTKMQDTWIELMKNYLINEPVLNREALDEDFRLRKQGGSARADKLLQGQLNGIIAELNEYMYDDGGRSA